MSRKIWDFVCPDCGLEFERLVGDGEGTSCPACTSPAPVKRLAMPQVRLEGITGAFPTASDRWARVHEQATKVAYKRNEGAE